MAIRTIITMEDPLLRKKSREIKNINLRVKEQVADMVETLQACGNGIGLAAPQVGLLKRIFVIQLEPEDPTLVFINPEILESSGAYSMREGCLSVPGASGIVTRPDKLTVKALDIEGKEFTLEADGLLATCICHEYDHLEGVLFIDKADGEISWPGSEDELDDELDAEDEAWENTQLNNKI